MLPSQIAFRAADYMAEHGNCKYTLEDRDGRVCLKGAILAAMFGKVVLLDFDTACLRAAGLELWDRLGFLIRQEYICADPFTFNDDLAENGEDVILMLKKAGKDLEERGR